MAGMRGGVHVELEVMTERCEHRGIDAGCQEMTLTM